MLETVDFNLHINAYRVQEPALTAGLHIYNFNGDQYISPKTYLCDI